MGSVMDSEGVDPLPPGGASYLHVRTGVTYMSANDMYSTIVAKQRVHTDIQSCP